MKTPLHREMERGTGFQHVAVYFKRDAHEHIHNQKELYLVITISSISWSEAFPLNFLPAACSLKARSILHRQKKPIRLKFERL